LVLGYQLIRRSIQRGVFIQEGLEESWKEGEGDRSEKYLRTQLSENEVLAAEECSVVGDLTYGKFLNDKANIYARR